MILGIGVDMIEISRIAKAVSKKSFFNKYFTISEQKLCDMDMGCCPKDDNNSKTVIGGAKKIAGNFAVKEAVAKALGTGFLGFEPIDIEVLRDEYGKPYVNLSKGARVISAQKGVDNVHVTISNTKEYAIAYVILEKNGNKNVKDSKGS